MTRAQGTVALLAAALALPLATGAASAREGVAALQAHQEPRGIGNLVVPGDSVRIGYTIDTRGVRSPSGSLFVRSNRERSFVRVPLNLRRGPQLWATVPQRLVHGRELRYYAVLRDGAGRSLTLPAAGAQGPSVARVLADARIVRLGVHRFGRTRGADAVVARAGPDIVGYQAPLPGEFPGFGPQTFLVGRDGSVWIHDGVNQRLLVFRRGAPDTVARSLALPFAVTFNDVALGPAGSVYVVRGVGRGLEHHYVLDRLSATGEVLWETRLAGELTDASSFVLGANRSLRTGPDGTLYCLAGMPGRVGGEQGWMPVATPAGRPLTVAQQVRGTRWPYQPVRGGLRLISELKPRGELAPREARFALVDRRGRVVRSWRVLSGTDVTFGYTTPELVGGDPVVVLHVTKLAGDHFDWEYLVLRLGPRGVRARFSLRRAFWGDQLLPDVRTGPDGRVYQLVSSPETGIRVLRYAVG